MSDLRGQFRVVNDSPKERPKKSFETRLKRRKFARAYKCALIISVIAAGIIAYLIYEKTKIYETYSVASSVKRSEATGLKLADFNGNLLTYSKDGAGATDPDGNLLWNMTFDMQAPMMAMKGGMVAFADYGGSKVYVQSEKGENVEISTAMPISKIRISSNGYILAVLEDSNVTWIYMYDMNGTVIAYFRTTMEKSGYPIDVDISDDGELVCVSYYYLDSNEEKSSVAFYNFGSVGQNNIDNYVSGYNYTDKLVPKVLFLNSSSAVSVSEDSINFYAGEHKPVNIGTPFLCDNLLSVFSGKDMVGLVFDNEANGTKYRLDVYDAKSNLLCQKEFDFDYSMIAFSKDVFVICGDSSLYIGTYSGDMKYEGNYSEDIVLVIPAVVQNKFIFVTEKSIDTVEFD